MSRGKKLIAICCAMIGVGIVLCIVGASLGGLVTGIDVGMGGIKVYAPKTGQTLEKITYRTGDETLESFDSIKVDADYAEITIQPADRYGIAYKLNDKYEFSYEVKDGVLSVSQKCPKNTSISYYNFSIGNLEITNRSEYSSTTVYEKEYITVYVPEGSKFQNVDIKALSGNVTGSHFDTDTLQLSAEYGDVELEEVGSQNAKLIVDSGDINITAFADGNITIEDEYGDVTLSDITAAQMNLKVVSGNFEAKGVIAEDLTVEDEYGHITLENVKSNGMNLSVDSGNISIVDAQTGECVVYSEYGDVEGRQLSAASVRVSAMSGTIKVEDVETEAAIMFTEYGNIEGDKLKADTLSAEVDSGSCSISNLDIKNVELKVEYGDATLGLLTKLTDYSYDLKTEYGGIVLGNKDMGDTYKSLEEKDRKIVIDCESGSIQLEEE